MSLNDYEHIAELYNVLHVQTQTIHHVPALSISPQNDPLIRNPPVNINYL